jgi:hypothetical protein
LRACTERAQTVCEYPQQPHVMELLIMEQSGESGERLCNEHLDEKAIVPSCGLATLTERLFTWRTADQVVCNVADNREVGRSIVGSHPALVIAEGHVHDPVKSILDAPVIANSRPDLVRGPRRRGNITRVTGLR